MKKIITGIIVLTALNFSVSAQDVSADAQAQQMDRRQQHNNRINPRLLEQLDLTAAQKDQIKIINEDYRSKMQDMIKSEIPAEERKTKRMQFETDRKNKILALLTQTQLEKLKTLQMKERAEGRQDRGDDQGKGEYKEKIKTDDGKTKIKVKND